MSKQVLLITKAREEGWLLDTANPTVARLYDFADQVSALGDVTLHVTTLDQLDFSVEANAVSVYDNATQKDISEYDIVHLRTVNYELSYYTDYAKAIALYVHHCGKALLEPTDAGAAFGKLAQAMLFALNGIKIPRTRSKWNGAGLADFCIERRDKFPLIVKASLGTQGYDNYLVKSADELKAVLAGAMEPFVVQNQIPNDGDYRVLFLGEAEPFIFWRPRIPGSHLSNTSQGSVPEKNVQIDSEALRLAKDVQKLTGRICVGVDLMQDNQTGEWYVLEANTNPALATGAFNDEKARRYAYMILQAKNEENS